MYVLGDDVVVVVEVVGDVGGCVCVTGFPAASVPVNSLSQSYSVTPGSSPIVVAGEVLVVVRMAHRGHVSNGASE